MKYVMPIIGAVVLSCLPSLGQVTTETEKKLEADGSVTTTKTVTFNQENVIKFFDSYKGQRYGLPPEWSTSMRVTEIPATWRAVRLAPGTMILDTHRVYLHAAPEDLLKVLPPAPSGVKYFVAGSNVIAVDADYRVLDSVLIPSIKFVEE